MSGRSLVGQAALVTGSTGGIGEGIARELAAAGADVMLNGFGDSEAVAALRRSIEIGYGVRTAYSPADLSNLEQVRSLVAEAITAFGRLDILVNNAGVQFTSRVENFPDEQWQVLLAINLSAPFYSIKAVLPHMQARGTGRIINVASAHGLVASAEKSAYVAAKHGLLGLTKVVALENAASGITCNALCPGWVLTPLVQKQIDARAAREGVSVEEAGRRLLAEKQPAPRFATPAQIGAAVVFLCSDAGSAVTGSSWSIDGGWTAQ